MSTELHWLNGPWPGKLALAARPRGRDWLSGEVANWKRAGVDVVVSLLTSAEEEDLGLCEEANEVGHRTIEFSSFPIPDREVPKSEEAFAAALIKMNRQLSAGRNPAGPLPPRNRAHRFGCGLSAG